eukprot:jgi/Chlat1/6385/Chrsp44S05845
MAAAMAAAAVSVGAVQTATAAAASCAVRPARQPARAVSAYTGLRKDARLAAPALSAKKQSSRAASRRLDAQATAAVEAPAETDQAVMEKAINAIRFLAIDAVQKANSGHPGLPMGCAPMGYILYNEVMKFNPKNPYFSNRDRFVLSAGHGCMLQYALLHLTGYDSVKTEDLKQFRQWGSKTPGHPENFETPGVEVTTGPLGQGIANAVGLAAAEKHLAARYNRPGHNIIDHYTYCILGDGCNMEGVSNEAASLAGHWGLGKLICLYDDNHISIDGHTDIAFTEDVSARFAALGWHVQHVPNGNNDYDSIRNAIEKAKKVTDKPSFIKVTTIIGYGSPNKADSHDVHGAALGDKEVAATRENLGWPYAPFEVPEDVKKHYGKKVDQGAAIEAAWNKAYDAYKKEFPEEAAEYSQLLKGDLPAGWEAALPVYTTESKADATRNLSQTCLNALAPVLPGLLGGSADLASSNMTLMKMYGNFQKETPAERNVRFGVREFGMGAIVNGFALHTPGLIPYCATFFVFTDYMRGAMRLSALAECGVIFVMTHDSIGLGEDGPTHQPIEHLASFRAMPNILTLRPADGKETAGAYKIAVQNRKRPSILVLSRQKLQHQEGTSVDKVAKGGYVVSCNSPDGTPDVLFMGTGSELEICEAAAQQIRQDGRTARVVSMVCTELFDEQPQSYKDEVLPPSVKARVSLEAASTFGWHKYVGDGGKSIGVDTFGASAPADRIYKEFGLTADNVAATAKSLL